MIRDPAVRGHTGAFIPPGAIHVLESHLKIGESPNKVLDTLRVFVYHEISEEYVDTKEHEKTQIIMFMMKS